MTAGKNVLRQAFANPSALLLLALLPVLGMSAVLTWRRRCQALELFGRPAAVARLIAARDSWRLPRVVCLGFGLLLVIVGIAGPRWGRDAELALAPGRDLVVLLDVSRSMLAEDVLPNRLERAKQGLRELADAVQRRGGHRLGLVVAAGHSRVVCPLTHDYDHFRSKLAELEPLSPELRPKGGEGSGTRLGAGLASAVQAHDPRFRGHQDVLLISDGDDPARDEEWRQGIAEARSAGVPIDVVGIGDPEAGGRIPLGDGFVQHDGQEVRTRLQEQPLEEIARQTGGTYIPARISVLNLGDFFRDRIESQSMREESDDSLPIYRQRYAWFFGAAGLFLTGEMVLGPFRRRKT